MMIIALQGFR